MRWWRKRRQLPPYDDVLARCVAAMQTEGAGIDACLAAYPVYAARLEPALRAAVLLQQRLATEPSAAFIQRARARTLAAAGGIRAVAPVVHAPPPRLGLLQRPAWRLPLASGIAAALLLAVWVPLLAVTSQDAVPGDWNYGLKRATEDLQLAVRVGDRDERAYQLALAERRANEVARLARMHRTTAIDATLDDYRQRLEKATQLLSREDVTNDPSLADTRELKRLQESTVRQEAALRAAATSLAQVPAAVPSPGVTPPVTPVPPPVDVAPARIQSALSAVSVTRDRANEAVMKAEESVARSMTPPTPAPTAVPSPAPEPATVATAAVARPSVTAPAATPAGTPDALPAGSATVPAAAGTAPAVATGTATPPAITAAATPAVTPAALSQPTPAVLPAPAPVPTTDTAQIRPNGPLVSPPSGQPPAASTPAPVVTPPVSATPVLPAAPPAPSISTPAPAAAPLPPVVAQTPPVVTPPLPLPVTPAATPRPTGTIGPVRTPVAQTQPQISVYLTAGANHVVYAGASPLFIDQLFPTLAGKVIAIEWRPPGSPVLMRWAPNTSFDRPLLLPGSFVTVYLREPAMIEQRADLMWGADRIP